MAIKMDGSNSVALGLAFDSQGAKTCRIVFAINRRLEMETRGNC